MNPAGTPSWLRDTAQGVVLQTVVQPRASRTEIVGPHGDPPRLKIRLAAPPVDGEANEELVRFLAKTLGIAKSQISLLRGHQSKQKDVVIQGRRADSVLPVLQRAP